MIGPDDPTKDRTEDGRVANHLWLESLIIRLINSQTITEWTRTLDKYKTKQISDPKGNPLSYSRLYNWKLSLHPSLGPQGVSRQVNSAFFQLKLGHGYLKGYCKGVSRHTTRE